MNCSYEASMEKASERSPLLDRGAVSTNPSDSIFSRAVICILLAQLFEELAFLGLGGNLQLFASDEAQLNCSPQMASTIMYFFQGTKYFLLSEWTCTSRSKTDAIRLHGPGRLCNFIII